MSVFSTGLLFRWTLPPVLSVSVVIACSSGASGVPSANDSDGGNTDGGTLTADGGGPLTPVVADLAGFADSCQGEALNLDMRCAGGP